MHLNCAKCGRQLTAECVLGEDTDYSREAVDREPSVKRGIIVKQTKDISNPTTQNGEIIGWRVETKAGDFSVNPADALPDILTSTGKDVGCCGSDGCDGPNRSCTCGAVIGTEWSDCWTQAEVRFISNAVVVSDQQ